MSYHYPFVVSHLLIKLLTLLFSIIKVITLNQDIIISCLK